MAVAVAVGGRGRDQGQAETLLTVHRPSHLRHPPPTTQHPLSPITRRSAPDHTRHCTPSCPLSLLDPSPSLGPPLSCPPRARARDEGGGGRGHRSTAWARVVSSVLPVLMGVWQDLEYLGYFQHRTCRSLLYLQQRGKLKGQNRASQANRLGARGSREGVFWPHMNPHETISRGSTLDRRSPALHHGMYDMYDLYD